MQWVQPSSAAACHPLVQHQHDTNLLPDRHLCKDVTPTPPSPQKRSNFSAAADDAAGDELLHDLVGASVDGLDARVHKRPAKTHIW